jgi:hypothetical protein
MLGIFYAENVICSLQAGERKRINGRGAYNNNYRNP